ncbi:adenylate/guanylate cyclase domain-containing protein [Microvirga brassicacearum]|uniref:Tetratricopeptide repeat protein n=1 Tax=Microvirga brassicacearum TaxID=2580413 RepID=A0A5N3P977_9HYPH|nr:adenylate/guanylate cyclase domain-containing protein [Microvirga brassicacearum]KAB0266283.1 tetratricopeptide repeat protein [Microvirga brassicacearum]
MAAAWVERRLAAILAADVVGYSHRVEQDEAGTLTALKALQHEVFAPLLAEHHGRTVKLMGDGLIAEFGSVVDAVACAVAVQKDVAGRQAGVPAERRIVFRIGVNLGDVVVDAEDLLGDGVNISARLEQICEPGGIMISGTAYDHLRGKLDLTLEFAGEQRVKNLDRPIRAYRVRLDGWSDPTQPVSSAGRPDDKPSIAVLPFTNMSGDAEQEYFSDGITEDIITALSRLRWFFVIARSSMFVYKGQFADAKQVGRDLRVRYLLEGSVRKIGQRVRITSQLIDAVTGNHIWAERYDRELADIFALQDEITASVTAAIEPKLLAAEGIRAELRSVDDLNAWDLVARGLSHFWKLTAAESETAITILRQAVQRYPNYAPAHSMLAFALLVSAYVGWIPAGCDREFAAHLAHRAVELDEDDPWAHAALGYLAFTGRRTDDAVRHLHAALDLNPNFAAAHGALGWTLVFDGRSEEALCCFEQALRMSPRDPLNGFILAGIAAAHYLATRYPEAVKWARQAVQLRPGILGAHRVLCASLAQAGQVEEATSAISTLRQLQPNVSLDWVRDSVPYTMKPMAHFLEGLRKAGLTAVS